MRYCENIWIRQSLIEGYAKDQCISQWASCEWILIPSCLDGIICFVPRVKTFLLGLWDEYPSIEWIKLEPRILVENMVDVAKKPSLRSLGSSNAKRGSTHFEIWHAVWLGLEGRNTWGDIRAMSREYGTLFTWREILAGSVFLTSTKLATLETIPFGKGES